MTDRARLEELASLYGVETAYYDALGNHRVGTDEAVLWTLASLGADVQSLADVPAAIGAFHRGLWAEAADRVVVAWGNARPAMALRVPEGATGAIVATLALEGGGERVVEARLEELTAVGGGEVDHARYLVRRLDLGDPLPPGYHGATLEGVGEGPHELTIIASPGRAHTHADMRAWGVFLPLYSLHSARSPGIGDATDLEALVRFVGGLGGDVVGTLPLLSTFLEEPYEYSPYAPVSRLFWNELFVDPARCPELERSATARELLASDAYLNEVAALRDAPLVDYARQYALLRPVLEALSAAHFAGSASDELRAFEQANPHARSYAAFRAFVETHGPPSERTTAMTDDPDPRRVRYHLYAQLRASEQLGAACRAAKEMGVGLYLDMPLGVHPDGYDAHRFPEAFVPRLSAGAPPDALFTGGQKWGFAPLAPNGLRRSGYAYLRECLAHQMRGAGVLRIDHVMGLHRLYCIPEHMDATEGVYVRMPHDELYAVVTLESHRHGTTLIGEDLGTVPDAVREAMDRHSLHRMYVLPFELRPAQPMIMGEIPEASVASANTHDLPTWQGWWDGSDVDVRRDMGLLDEAGAEAEKDARRGVAFELADRLGVPREPGPTLEASLTALASSDARLLLVNLEDLWLEGAPQNVPGTHRERPNWRRKSARSLETMRADERVLRILTAIDARRRQRRES